MKPIDQLINDDLQELLEDLNSGRKITFCLRKHVGRIQALLDDGITIKKIHDATAEKHSISYEYFRKALRKARYVSINNTKSTSKTNSMNRENFRTVDLKKNIDLKETTNTISNNTVYSNDDWSKAFGISTHERIFGVLIEELSKYGWTPDNYYKLKNKLDVTTEKRLCSLITIAREHKATNKEFEND